MATVLVVEDEPDLRALLVHHLHSAGHLVREAGSVAEAWRLVADAVPDVIVLDLMLPDGSGVGLCQRLRESVATRDVPVLMLTALTQEPERVQGFEAGADDYVTKPYSPRELVLRVQSLLRRHQPAAAPSRWSVGPVSVDSARHQVWVDEREVRMTALELKLLSTLMRRAGLVQTRRQLLEDVWGVSPDLHTRTVDTHVQRLRERLGSAGTCIETVHGVGYCFRAADKPT